MNIEKNSRQIPTTSNVVRDKNYCDLLYAWAQCNSERISLNSSMRRIEKSLVKWTKIEEDFTRYDLEGNQIKTMERRTIAKYFKFLIEKGLITEDEDFYYLAVLPPDEANLIEYNTLQKMMNTMQRHCISIYVYLFNRFYANGCQPFCATMKQIKTYLGIATTTTSNNLLISDSIEILGRLGLLKCKRINQDGKTLMIFDNVQNKLS